MMRILRQMRDLFLYCGISKEDYRSIKKEAYIANFRVWKIVHRVLVFVAFFMMCTHLTGWPTHFGSPLFIARMVLFFYFFIMSILFNHVLKEDGIAAQLFIYLTMIVLLIFALFLGLRNPAMMSTLLLVLLVLLPMFMIDKPYFMAILIVIASLVHTTHVLAVKEPEALRGDLIYTALFCLLGVAINTFYNMLRVREFMFMRQQVTHLNEEKRSYKKAHDLYSVITAMTVEYDILAGVDYANGVAEYFRALPWTGITVADSPDGRGEMPFTVENMQNFCFKHVDPEYQERFLQGIQIGHVLDGTDGGSDYTFRFRVLKDGKRPWYELRAVSAAAFGDHSRVIMGIRNIDAEIREETQRQKEKQEKALAAQTAIIANLAGDYASILYVTVTPDRTTDKMRHFRASETMKRIVPGSEKEKNFHNWLDLIMRYAMVDEDRNAFFVASRREVILSNLTENGMYHFNFRVNIDGKPAYCQLKFAGDRDENGNIRGLIVGLRRIDREICERIMHEQKLTAINERAERTIARRTAELKEKNNELLQTGEEVIELLGDVVEMRDAGSGKHVRRVKAFTRILATQVQQDLPEYGLTDDDVNLIASASALHDLGKIRISDTILLKQGALTAEEHRIMQSHCEKGCEILRNAPRNWDARFIRTGMEICRYHHEKWDGAGYPDGLKGDAIPISAQIVSLADCYDALTSERPYKKAFSSDLAAKMIESGECGMFSDKLMSCFRACIDRFNKAALDPGVLVSADLLAPHKYLGGTRLSGMHILCVDDSEPTRSLAADVLRGESASVVTAASGAEALKVFPAKGPFDAVLIDLTMPDMDGFELTERLRELDRVGPVRTPLIVLTAGNAAEKADRAFQCGADACMVKPPDIGDLSRFLQDSIRRRNESIGAMLTDTIVTTSVDTLTHVKTIAAYTDMVTDLSAELQGHDKPAFAFVMCDLNDLQKINSTYGHDVGDVFIRNCCRIICQVFALSPVFRIGGDEFAVLLRGKEYEERNALMEELEHRIAAAAAEPDFEQGRASFTVGMAVYDPKEDTGVTDVIRRAERAMRRSKDRLRDREQA